VEKSEVVVLERLAEADGPSRNKNLGEFYVYPIKQLLLIILLNKKTRQ
jgi:hypothetical protein